MTDLDALEKLALAATQGLWRACGGDTPCKCRQVWALSDDVMIAVGLRAQDETYTCGQGVTQDQAQANALLIAAANPATVLALIRELRAAREVVAEAVVVIARDGHLSDALAAYDRARDQK